MNLEKNLKSLEQNYPELADQIRNTGISSRYTVQESETKGCYNLHSSLYGSFYKTGNPQQEVIQEITGLNIRMPELCLIIGFGLGYHLDAYIKNFGSNNLIIIFEKDIEVLRLALSRTDLSEQLLSKSIVFCVGKSPQMYSATLFYKLRAGDSKFYLKAVNYILSGFSYKMDKDYYTQCIKVFKEAAKSVMGFYSNDPSTKLKQVKNLLMNINVLFESADVRQLENAFPNTAGLLVAGGNSLNKSIDKIRKLVGKAVIVTMECAIPCLQKNQIKPNFIVTMAENQENPKPVTYYNDEEAENVYHVSCPTLAPEIYSTYPGKTITAMQNTKELEWFNIDRGSLNASASEETMALELLSYMGCNPIVLVGLDFSIDVDDISDINSLKPHTVFADGNLSPKVATTLLMNNYRKLFEQAICATSADVINATEGGVRISGTEHSDLLELEDKLEYSDVDIVSHLSSMLSFPDLVQQEQEHISLQKSFYTGIKYIQDAVIRLNEAVKNYKNFSKTAFSGGEDINTLYDIAVVLKKHLDIFKEKDFISTAGSYVEPFYVKSMIDINGLKAGIKLSPVTLTAISDRYSSLYATTAKICEKIVEELAVIAVINNWQNR